MKTLDDVLRSREFNQALGKALIEWARDGKRDAYEKIAKAGYKAALEKMENWTCNNGLSFVYVRDFLEDIIDVRINETNEEKIDAMTMEEYDEWLKRANEYSKDKKEALIPRNGYKEWFIEKWFSNVRF